MHILLDQIGEAAREEGIRVRGLKKSTGSAEAEYATDWVTNIANTDKLVAAAPRAQLVAGTAWLFADARFDCGALIDTLVIDEAGQGALAPALAMGTAARNLILLGDSSELAQGSPRTDPSSLAASL